MRQTSSDDDITSAISYIQLQTVKKKSVISHTFVVEAKT